MARLALLAGVLPGAPARNGKIVCACFAVGEAAIRDAIDVRRLASPAEIGAALGAGTNCGSCIPEIPQALGGRRRFCFLSAVTLMAPALDGLTILVPESRELDLFAGMLEADGAVAVRCPLVRILDLEETSDAQTWIARLMAGGFDDVIWLTGEGLRHLLVIAERHSQRPDFIAALSRLRMITRGPKPARVLRELGLTPGLAATVPTSQGVLDALAGQRIEGRRIGVQLYPGEGGLPLVDALRDRGAMTFPVTPYRYASQAEAAQVVSAIQALASGRIDMVAFTSSPQVERLFEVAHEAGIATELGEALQRVLIAAIGPVVEQALHRHRVTTLVRPDTSFHLKPLMRAIAVAWAGRRQAGEPGAPVAASDEDP